MTKTNTSKTEHSIERTPTVSIIPETFRLPSGRERDPYFGLGRSYWNSKILPNPTNGYKPEVKSYVLRRKGSRTGVRLIDYQSARDLILSNEQKGETEYECLTKQNSRDAVISPSYRQTWQFSGRPFYPAEDSKSAS